MRLANSIVKKNIFVIVILSLTLGLTFFTAPSVKGTKIADESVPLFYSDFSRPDPRWKVRHTPTPDLPAADFATKYTPKGRLRMRLVEQDGQVYTSHVATLGQPFVYGRFEARMRFKSPKGAHSAFWLQDVKPDYLGGSEVDIVEHFGSGKNLWHNVYWRTPETMWPKSPAKWRVYSNSVNPRRWHVYGLIWKPDKYVFTIDGRTVAVSRVGLSSTPKVMILSLLSSTWEWPNRADDLSVYRTMVDWVRVRPL